MCDTTEMEKEIRNPEIQSDLTIIGSGMAGLSAALFALNRGMKVVLTGKSSSMNFATGLMDLMGVYPAGSEWESPWDAIDALVKEIPSHPYARIKRENIRDSLQELMGFLNAMGLSYRMGNGKNVNVITSLGTIKKSYMIPEPMWKGVTALDKKASTLVVDFAGMKIYSARQIVSTLGNVWPGLRSARIDFPGMERLEEVYPEHIARALDVEENRLKLAELVKILLTGEDKNVEYIGFPALLGMHRVNETIASLEKALGKPVFEIPTPPVSVPGIRLYDTMTRGIEKIGALQSLPEMVQRVELLPTGPGRFRLTVGHEDMRQIIISKGVILATGRFMGRGLKAERTGIRESLLDLPVTQPEKRELWHHKELFHPEGHPVNSAGIETDELLRPLASPATPFAENMYAAGSILAHSDWTRMKCGSGVAIATAFAAVKAFSQKGIKD
ncbi:GlpB3 [Desulfamplus magnetovallimortis]|uniref:GlpB3 n=1 Tax=Desulfamplus magnetovallimortis TaxID=1246637 RepID=A0A1W1HBF9_9BACT|nr:glycerol-3-phosphate dehydrogenase subunit GlpB [Desulfamplus magnetovallimortis]SLM29742.1 GlpB3 [Desulfamplus magnetovallimortis]